MSIPNNKTKGDYLHKVVEVGLNSLPFGSILAAIFDEAIQPPLEKRRQEWFKSIDQRLRRLEEDDIDISGLINNNLFIDMLLEASAIAIKSSEQEKLLALQNAVINTALNESIADTSKRIFVQKIDQFTVWHLKLLQLMSDPRLELKRQGKKPNSYIAGSISQVVFQAFPFFEGNKELLDIIWNDLYSSGFVTTSSVASSGSSSGMYNSRTTEFGEKFLHFVKDHN